MGAQTQYLLTLFPDVADSLLIALYKNLRGESNANPIFRICVDNSVVPTSTTTLGMSYLWS